MIRKTAGECGKFNYLGSMITKDVKCSLEIKSRIAVAKALIDK